MYHKKINYLFYQVNSDFSQKLADKKYNGEESVDNVKYLWEDEFSIKGNIDELLMTSENYILNATIDGKSFKFEIPSMLIHTYKINRNITHIACSKSLIINIEKEENDKELNYKFYLTDNDVIVNPITGIYISINDFPNELKSN